METNKKRLIYAGLFCILLATEITIALFVRDDFIRPYVGDMLVTWLICSLVRIFIPDRVRLMPLYVFLFAATVEILQYFDVVALLGLESSKLLSTLIGRTFSVADILCYAVGCIIAALAQAAVYKKAHPEG